ncbi:MAG: T9SS type A sorting domain-containing protein [Saprospiraceae bacterium]
MKISIKILIFLLLSQLIYSQDRLFSNFEINSHYFPNESDTLIIGFNLTPENLNSQNSNDLNYLLIISSLTNKCDNEYPLKYYFLESSETKTNDENEKHYFKIPVFKLESGKYSIELEVSDGYSAYYLSDYIPDIYPIAIGKSGISISDIELDINGINTIYNIINEKPENYIPDTLEGIFTTGFCADEILKLSKISICEWDNKNTINNIKTSISYFIDDKDTTTISNYKLVDDSSDGILVLPNNKTISSELYNTVDYLERHIEFDNFKDNLIELVNSEESNEHIFNFFIEIEGENLYKRYPESGTYSFNYRVVSDPIGSDCQAALLPIDLLKWNVIKTDKVVHLEWETANEVNNDYFEIERGVDAINWKTIQTIEGKGNNSNHETYSSTDNLPLSGTSYYRLKQTDFNGDNKYSPVRSITNIDNELIFYPNPIVDILNYQVVDTKRQFLIEIYNTSGKLVKTQIVPDKTSEVNYLDLSYLAKGIYLLKYINLNNYKYEISKIVKL